MNRDGFGRLLLLHVAALSTAGAVAAAAVLRRRYRRKMKELLPAPAMAEMPKVVMAEHGHVEHIEKFSHYVARQMGFEEASECPQLCKVANNYLRKTKNCMDDIYDLLANAPDAESLYVKLVEELDKCILGYFAFHWDLCTTLISQALTVDSATKKKLRNLVLEATRKQRFERITRDLKVTRVFSTLVEEMKAIGIVNRINGDEEAQCTDVMAPVAHADRSPVLLLMGGGMGAGKSTVLKEILEDSDYFQAVLDGGRCERAGGRGGRLQGDGRDLPRHQLHRSPQRHAPDSRTGAPVVDGRGVVAAGDGAERGAGRDPGRHALLGALRGADRRHGPRRAPPAPPDGRRLQGGGRRHRHRELLGARPRGRGLHHRGRDQEAVPDRDRRGGLRRIPRRRQRDQESDHHGEGGEGEVAAHVAQEIRGGVPEILPSSRRGQAVQFQLIGLSSADRVEGWNQQQPAGGAERDRLPRQGGQPQRERHLPARPLPRRRHRMRVTVHLGRHDRLAVPRRHPARDPGGHPRHGPNSDPDGFVAYRSIHILLSLDDRQWLCRGKWVKLGKLELFWKSCMPMLVHI